MPKGFLRTVLALTAALVGGVAIADDAHLVKRSYPIGEFVYNVRPDPTPPAPVPPVPVQPTVTPVQAAQFAAPVPTPPPVRQLPPEVRRNAELLARMVVNVVKPYSWAEMGGAGRVTFDEATCSLVVVQTADIHAHVADLLASMRRVHVASMPQVHLELTAVEVPETFFEQARVDGGACVKTVGASEPACPDGEVCQAMKAVRATEGAKSPTTVLSDTQTAGLMECLKSARESGRVKFVIQPKLMLTDMQTGHIQAGQTSRFLIGLELTAGPNGVERKPQYRTVQFGTTIRATPTVSADRQFVRLRLNYQTAQPSAAAATAVKVGEGADAEVLAHPGINTQEIRSNVVIPTGKTVLLAGPVETRDERTQCCPPVLSKVPHVNRLFDSRFIVSQCTGQTKYRHLLLVTANVMNSDDDGCPASDCKACPAACEAVAVAKPARPADAEAARLVAAYHKACADGRTEDALRMAMQALARDPNCFATEK